ncbi:hypothetical protein FYK55_07015 [Roseiconus nitratireducens]|uniref:Uncharacterized protein n=1 Tax=Roseiconus nitratireducens TaxID=2605748 RepID=A0A5M6DCY4_9BACT|nr:hypothetical protein [Roseiconus nitratireducens]KAA5545394.1 hypothetical protein FYK55_07015 [Roseiconus nitratireducens]
MFNRSSSHSIARHSVWIAVLTAMAFVEVRLAGAQAQTPETTDQGSTPYGRWTNGVSDDPEFFPIAVWLQAPKNAKRYRDAGINLYVGLYRGPTEEQLRVLDEAGMETICSQNGVGLNSEFSDVIVGWMHGDEPDNAQARRDGKGYGPPIEPQVIVENYERLRAADPTRPIFLNLGQGVAYDNYIGRGVRRNHLEDYPEYIKGCDIVSFDIYPVVHRKEQIAGKLEYVPKGVERLRRWADPKQIVWNCIECSRISNTEVKPTAEQVRSEVWMSLIHGSQGIIYFVHQFEPRFREASLLDDPELLAGVTAINRQIRQLAPVLNSPTVDDVMQVVSEPEDASIKTLCKRHGGKEYVFAVNLQNRDVNATFQLTPSTSVSDVDVLGEERTLRINDGQFQDAFGGYGVHLYRIR